MSLADSLLTDLDGLSDEESPPSPPQPAPSRQNGNGSGPSRSMPPPPLPPKAMKRPAPEDDAVDGQFHVKKEPGMEDEEDEEGDIPMGYVPPGGVRPAEELDSEDVENEDLSGVEDVGKVARLIAGTKLREVLDVSSL